MTHEIGTVFVNMDGNKYVISGTQTFNGNEYYLTVPINGNGESQLHCEDNINHFLKHNVDLTPEKVMEKRIAYQREQERAKERERKEKEKHDQEMTLYGYADTLKGVKLERVRTTLLKRFFYDGCGRMTRADFVKHCIDTGREIESYIYRGKPAYRAWNNDRKWFTDITKTEYDFSQWLKEA